MKEIFGEKQGDVKIKGLTDCENEEKFEEKWEKLAKTLATREGGKKFMHYFLKNKKEKGKKEKRKTHYSNTYQFLLFVHLFRLQLGQITELVNVHFHPHTRILQQEMRKTFCSSDQWFILFSNHSYEINLKYSS